MAKNEFYQEMYKIYQQGYSLAEVGKKFGLSRQSIYLGFKRRKFVLRKKSRLAFLVFKGIKFTLRNTGYYARTDGDRQLMHRFVWENYNGKIERSYDIHHINHDKADNRIENLELYTKSEHAKIFATGNNQYRRVKVF